MKNLIELKCEKRKLLIRLEGAVTEEDVKEIQEELDKNQKEIEKEEARQLEIEKTNAELRAQLMGGFTPISQTQIEKDKEEAEKRANAFAQSNKMVIENAEARATLLSSGTLRPVKVGGINEPFETVSSIVDMVAVEDLTGTSEYKEGYVDSWGSASNGTEGTTPTQSEPTFGSVTLKPVLVNVISFVSKQVKKQTNLAYEEKVRKGALIALRKAVQDKITNSNVAGFYGILNALNDKGAKMNVELPLNAIDATTLRKIVLKYGGDETVPGGAVLYLNKNDLIKFGDVRGTNEKKALYEIMPNEANPNIGIIKEGGTSVKYCINSSVPENKLVYGKPLAYKLGLWGNYDVEVSDDYKFGEGLLTIRGEVMVGGNVVQKDGFVIATIGTTE